MGLNENRIKKLIAKLQEFKSKGSFDIIAKDSNGKYVFESFVDLINEYEKCLDKRDESDKQANYLSEARKLIRDIFELIDFSSAKNDVAIKEFMEYWLETQQSTVQDCANSTLTYILDDFGLDDLRKGGWYEVTFIRFAYVYAKILIERKELTKDLYDLLFPFLYRKSDSFINEIKSIVPVIPLSQYKDDYDWLKDIDEETEALTHIALGDMPLDTVYELYDGIDLNDKDDGDDDDGESPSPELVDA